MRNFPHLESAKYGSKILQNEQYLNSTYSSISFNVCVCE